MAASKELKAVQIVYAENDKIICKDILEEILLKDDLKDKRVCVVSITGTFRQGKSFIMNFFLRYLNNKYKGKRDVTNWLNPVGEPLSGFQWKSSSLPDTMGIMMWPEIFLGELPSGEEVAIILLDTQGMFDNQTSVNQCGKIFALSCLISSLQIYNLNGGIKQYDLSHLQIFSDFGELLQSDPRPKHSPFQSILFLIRDWSHSHEFAYGKDGGQQYLKRELNPAGQTRNLNALKTKIKLLFGNIDCFLVPHPGKKVTSSAQFQGNIIDIEKDFIHHVETLVSTILAPDNLVIKSINGQDVTVSHLCNLIKNYCTLCQDSPLLELQSMHKATMAMQHIAAVEESTSLYENSMKFVHNSNVRASDENELKVKHNEAKEAAKKHYIEKKKLGNLEVHTKYESELDKKLENLFTNYEEMNKTKRGFELEKKELEEKLKKALEQLLSEERAPVFKLKGEREKEEAERKKAAENLELIIEGYRRLKEDTDKMKEGLEATVTLEQEKLKELKQVRKIQRLGEVKSEKEKAELETKLKEGREHLIQIRERQHQGELKSEKEKAVLETKLKDLSKEMKELQERQRKTEEELNQKTSCTIA